MKVTNEFRTNIEGLIIYMFTHLRHEFEVNEDWIEPIITWIESNLAKQGI